MGSCVPLPTEMHQFIYINGYPGVGKFTVARELQRILPNSKVYHNHLFIDPIAALVDRSSPEYNTIRTNYRRHLLNLIATSESERNTTCIFTDSRCNSEIGSIAVKDYEDASKRRGVPFIPIIMTCDPDENARRVVDESRGEGNCTKLRNTGVLRDIRQKEEMYRFGDERELELDVTNLSPTEAAQKIVDHIMKVGDTRLAGREGDSS